MFQWEKSIQSLNIPASQVLRLFRSMRGVQIALPGLPPQEASTYLCQYATERGVVTVVAFHLHKSAQLAFYLDGQQAVSANRAGTLLDQAQVFVESMGFLLTDLDIQLLDENERDLLWSTLPLQQGIAVPQADSSPAPAPPRASTRQMLKVPVSPATLEASPAKAAASTGQTVASGQSDAPQRSSSDVDLLLAAVEELRTRRAGVSSRGQAPTSRELQRRRQELRENLGRVLASL